MCSNKNIHNFTFLKGNFFFMSSVCLSVCLTIRPSATVISKSVFLKCPIKIKLDGSCDSKVEFIKRSNCIIHTSLHVYFQLNSFSFYKNKFYIWLFHYLDFLHSYQKKNILDFLLVGYTYSWSSTYTNVKRRNKICIR